MNPTKELAALLEKLGGIEPSVGDDFNPLATSDIKEIEAKVKGEVPTLCQELLLAFGSFRFKEDIFYTPVIPFPKKYSKTNRGIVGNFLGKKNPKYPRARSISILHLLDLLEEDLPPGFMPIADNGAGDLIGLFVNSGRKGQVALWNHDDPSAGGLYEVNVTFEKWLNSLTL